MVRAVMNLKHSHCHTSTWLWKFVRFQL